MYNMSVTHFTIPNNIRPDNEFSEGYNHSYLVQAFLDILLGARR